MKKILPAVCAMIAVSVLCGCVRQQTYPIIPHIDFKSVSKSEVDLPSTAGVRTDSVVVTLSFTDGDGDFGIPDGLLDTTCANCLCTDHTTDSRYISNSTLDVFYYTYTSGFTDSCISGISTKYIPNNAKYNALQGEIQFTIDVECGPTGPVDTLSYSFFIKDRAGHLSNRVRSPGIVINCN